METENSDWYKNSSTVAFDDASSSNQYENNLTNSAIIDMEDHTAPQTGETTTDSNVNNDFVSTNVSAIIWESSKRQAEKTFTNYANIDILRPYFNVEPKVVAKRLLHSLYPKLPSKISNKLSDELYGPLMIVFTLIAIVLYHMKSSNHQMMEGTLIGSAFFVCFGYWFGISSFLWTLFYMFSFPFNYINILSMLGYGLFSHCITLLLFTTVANIEHTYFYIACIGFGGLSSLKMLFVILSKSSKSKKEAMLIGIGLTIVHISFLLYLHFAYHNLEFESTFVSATHVTKHV